MNKYKFLVISLFSLSIIIYSNLSFAKILVIAPHPDDDVLIAAGIVYQAIQRSEPVRIVYMTNGDESGTDAGYLRQTEAVNAQVNHLGMIEDDLLFLGYPDGYLNIIYQNYTGEFDELVTGIGQSTTYGNRGLGSADYHSYRFGNPAKYNSFNVILDLKDIISTFKPDHIFTLSEFDYHEDHASTYDFLNLALQAVFAIDPSYTPTVHKTMVHVGSIGSSNWPNSPSLCLCIPIITLHSIFCLFSTSFI